MIQLKPVRFLLLGFPTIGLSLSARVPRQLKSPLRILPVTGGCRHNYIKLPGNGIRRAATGN